MLNKIMLIGYLGRDVEMSYTPTGKAVTKFSVAVSRRTKNAQGERAEETQWFPVVAWERLAEMSGQYLHKGAKVYVEGRMTSRRYTDRDNVQRTIWEVVASEIELLDRKSSEQRQPSEMADDAPPF